MNKIYVIGCGNIVTTEFANGKSGTDFTVVSLPGWYSTFEAADEAVRNNYADIWEHAYDYAIIEEVSEGLYNPDADGKFYKYNTEKGIYEPIEPPECTKHYCGYTIE